MNRQVWRVELAEPALILGSSQSKDLVDEAELDSAGIDLVVRKSGGGIVFLSPGDFLWIDITIPPNDPLATNDVATSALWLGELWCQVLSDFGLMAEVYSKPFFKGPQNGMVCFASRAPGEVIIGDATSDQKVVGISQRRSKAGTWFQTVLFSNWEPSLFLKYLSLPPKEKTTLNKDLAEVAFPIDLPLDRLTEAFFKRFSTI